jgi:hypothetical protein
LAISTPILFHLFDCIYNCEQITLEDKAHIILRFYSCNQ